jgi:hypothetical protein
VLSDVLGQREPVHAEEPSQGRDEATRLVPEEVWWERHYPG